MSNSNGGPKTGAKQGSFGGLVNIKSTAIPNTHFNLQVQITFDVYCFYAKHTAVDQLNAKIYILILTNMGISMTSFQERK